ncbi:Bug family tripartite tricarboxylate transporter substrate binding protein [Advenella mimigardefordensis]|uniref:Putative Bug-like extracytoplasmic solute binding receptor, TTT family n=1 Tax=Advenella mimigardefordensis (strain DSM 17166 / LMG 22922 / DPN7) TaxID=1247726 RepID=W0PF38_ADVMD|nr:tripartite tricarboxylate transporter substrate binding protein [Advenella mimigardefordensis]AHG64162.1 putative Bug-like extracytoplasmic solute binding receptor, TTT family [Advenella mimigardefordensis DPN7]
MTKAIAKIILGGVFVCTSMGATAADPFPSKPVRIVVPAAAGGALDLTTRLVAQKMQENLGQPVVVENKPGGDTLIATRLVKSAKPDGYTLLSSANGITLMPQLKADPGYDPIKDFTGIGFMTRSPLLIEVGSGQPDQTLTAFMDRVRSNPDKLSYGHAGFGTPPHIAAAAFLHAAKLHMLSIPYKGNGAALPDVIGNRVEMIVDGFISSHSYIKSGMLRPLAITSESRLPSLPDVPTLKESGVDYTYTLWLGLLAPSGTPPEVVRRLSDALRFATADKELNERFRSEGSDPSFVTPAAFNDYYKEEVQDMVQLARDLNLPKD